AQIGPSGMTASDIWQTGTQPTPGLSSARQLPNQQPAAAGQPVSYQPVQPARPSWSPQQTGIPLAGGTLFAGLTVGTFYDDNVFAAHTNHLADWAIFERPELQWVKQGQNYSFSADGFVENRDYARFG